MTQQPRLDVGFHAVYLLTSLDPLRSDLTYIGYTVNPQRRIRQHNGEITAGAHRTRRVGRPWTMQLCVHGFPNKHVALQFEWHWQHPRESTSLRDALQRLRGPQAAVGYQGGYMCKVALMYELLSVSPFRDMHLTIHLLHDPARFREVSEMLYTGTRPGRAAASVSYRPPKLSRNVNNVTSGSFDDLEPLRRGAGDDDGMASDADSLGEFGDVQCAGGAARCGVCFEEVEVERSLTCEAPCEFVSHIGCLASWFDVLHRSGGGGGHDVGDEEEEEVLPPFSSFFPRATAPCPQCGHHLSWGLLVQKFKERARRRERESENRRRAAFAERKKEFRKRCRELGL